MKWLLLTAGLSPEAMEKAAKRIAKKGNALFPFHQIVVLNQANFNEVCPTISRMYPEIFSEDTIGFGYYSWKIEMIYSALHGAYGNCDGIVWIDGGCEIYPTRLNRYIFRKQLERAFEAGYQFFRLQTPENLYTKEDMFNSFDGVDINDGTDQFQGTYFMLSGQLGKAIARRAYDTMISNIEIMNPEIMSRRDFELGVRHKSDQSLLSLTLKSFNLKDSFRVPPAGNRGRVSKIKASISPVWVSRNRTGRSIIPKWLEIFES